MEERVDSNAVEVFMTLSELFWQVIIYYVGNFDLTYQHDSPLAIIPKKKVKKKPNGFLRELISFLSKNSQTTVTDVAC